MKNLISPNLGAGKTKAKQLTLLKYLYLAPVALLIGFSFFFSYVIKEMHREVITEKMLEKKTEIELIVAQIDRYVELDKDWGVYNYAADISYVVEKLDKMYGVFAAVYDDRFRLLSARELSGETSKQNDSFFDPIQLSDFIIKAQYNNLGSLELPYNRDSNDNARTVMHTYFQWIPTKPDYEHRLLIVIGITNDSAQTHPQNFLIFGMIGLIAITFLLNLGLVISLRRIQRTAGVIT